jgi:DNA invertase Pin-like site-specific DNA recombinase
VSTEDHQDRVTSLARQRERAAALVAGHGRIVAEFFDIGQSRTLAWVRRPQAAALVAALVDPDRGWDAIVIGEYERALYGGQYSSMAPRLEHYGVQLWMLEVGVRVDFTTADHEGTMLALGLQPKREITRTRIRVRTAMATQTREQGRYLGGRPPYGYRLSDAGPHPNKAHAAWGRRAHGLEPDPETAPIVGWMFAQKRPLMGGIPCPRGDLNTQPRAISPDRGNHRTRVTGAGPACPGIRPGVRCLSRRLACHMARAAVAGGSAPAPLTAAVAAGGGAARCTSSAPGRCGPVMAAFRDEHCGAHAAVTA